MELCSCSVSESILSIKETKDKKKKRKQRKKERKEGKDREKGKEKEGKEVKKEVTSSSLSTPALWVQCDLSNFFNTSRRGAHMGIE